MNNLPRDPTKFSSDPRIRYSEERQTHILTSASPECFYDKKEKRWTTPSDPECDEFLKKQAEELPKKRRSPAEEDDIDSTNAQGAQETNKKKKTKNGKDGDTKSEQVNRAIYVTGIPKDANREEIEDEFGRFCGIIDVGADQKKRVKMYYNDDGTFKGEALIVFLRPESITSALNLMDDQPLRYGGAEKLKIQEADFSYKKEQVGATTAAKLSRADRKTLDLKRAELERARTAWSSDEEAEEVKPALNKHAKIVIVRNVFTKAELDDDPTLISEIKEELIGTNSAKGREVTSVQVYDLEPEGIVTVKFKEFDHATAFLKQANGRLWEGIEGVSEDRYIKAELASDRPKFRKSRGDEAVQSDSD